MPLPIIPHVSDHKVLTIYLIMRVRNHCNPAGRIRLAESHVELFSNGRWATNYLRYTQPRLEQVFGLRTPDAGLLSRNKINRATGQIHLSNNHVPCCLLQGCTTDVAGFFIEKISKKIAVFSRPRFYCLGCCYCMRKITDHCSEEGNTD